tara:strand:- start:67 stop:846 length:780 start_codon:yes stop_codon:yes gene_type:complete
VLKLEEPPSPALVLGSLRHEVHERMAEDEEAIVCGISEYLEYSVFLKKFTDPASTALRNGVIRHSGELRLFDLDLAEVFRRSWGYLLPQIEDRVKLLHRFLKREEVYGEELWKCITPKLLVEERVSDSELGLRGIVDRIELFDEEWIPIELKTGKAPHRGVWPGHEAQIGAYLLLLKLAKRPVSTGFIHYLDSDVKRAVTLSPFLVVHIRKLIGQVKNVLSDSLPPPHLMQKKKCDACSLKEQCYNAKFIEDKIRKVKG